MKLSDQDRSILREIQRDADVSLAALAERLGMAQSTLWRRMNDLQQAQIIRRKVALVDAGKVGAKLCVLAMVTLEDHSEEAVAGFTRMVGLHPEIQECMKVSGVADYILKIRAADVEAYEAFQTRHLLRSAWVRSVQSSFVLKEVKATTELPV
ncbi:MAG: Lrp/AsnC family transcriptional regulator [Silicimonas sp.]|nr:Lrp/AsnC family transcriptional regulator [Silicimonas sp.]NNF92894.1 Lrp/AsnC family transcriptional regulator [Boseongicola sp.]RZW01089.1 MAG: Lrp/AsnC family transcriptional regulator [Paracoccaceae bacterium]NND20427.1 Lrp/AsnC family transcriptional regulator [Silicimonas sp.]NND20464.1 Lrp/AsnC family transcriptional regulator [Silicimonas sp.]